VFVSGRAAAPPGNAPPGTYHITLQVWPRCTEDHVCWDPNNPHQHAGQPLAVVSADTSAAPGDRTVTLVHPLHIIAWQPPK